MEKRKILVRNVGQVKRLRRIKRKSVAIKCMGNKVYIGDMPQLVVDLKTQKNHIVYQGGTMAYHREIGLSRDLLEGKRKNVLDTAIQHYYAQACQVVKGKQIADSYRHKKVKELSNN